MAILHGGILINLGSLCRIATQDARQDETGACCRISHMRPEEFEHFEEVTVVALVGLTLPLGHRAQGEITDCDYKHVSLRGLSMRSSTS